MAVQVRDRASRIELVINIRKNHPEWDEKRVIDEVCVTTGVRPMRVREYVDLLKRTERW